MRAVFYVVIGLVVVAALAVAWAARHPALDPVETAEADYDTATIERGATLVALGNCGACHTAAGDKPLAGGVAIPTPFGTIYSTNITPDPGTGIGRWSLAAFRRAMRHGIDREGEHLYPAFPYTHYTKATDEDIEAIYAYLMTRPPIEATAPENELPFPLDIRMVVAGWNLLYLDEGPFEPDPNQSEAWNRGAYLAESLGHCGSCHTPRNALGAEITDRRFAGGWAEGWHAPALNEESPAPAPWMGEQLAGYLANGWHPLHGMAAGPMAEVARDLRQIPREDVEAIATYIASYQPEPDPQRAEAAVAFAEEREWTALQLASLGADGAGAEDRGALIFAGACGTCHHRGGLIPHVRPVPLGLSTAIALNDPTNFLQIVVHGIEPEEGMPGPIMPPFGDVLDDGRIADLAAYVRSRFTEEPAWEGVAAALEDVRSRPRAGGREN